MVGGRRRRLIRLVVALAAVGWWAMSTTFLWMPPPKNPTWDWEWLDESVHLTLFFGIAALARAAGLSAPVVLTGCVLWAGVTELVQGQLPWPRTPQLGDAIADTIGALLGLGAVAVLARLRPADTTTPPTEGVGGALWNGRDSNPR